jgi:hypothetical protein
MYWNQNTQTKLARRGPDRIVVGFTTTCVIASWYLTSLSTTLQLYRGGQFYWWRKPPTYRKSLTHFIT